MPESVNPSSSSGGNHNAQQNDTIPDVEGKAEAAMQFYLSVFSDAHILECVDETEQQAIYKQLSQHGQILMPLNNYGFSRKFGWVNDRFGASWQLNLK